MSTVFLSYSRKDYFFAELADIKLKEANVDVWRDQGRIGAGEDWRQQIEKGISDSLAVLVVLSENSAISSYVTFEWAYALGNGKVLIPIKLGKCDIHPRLQIIQYLNVSNPESLPWEALIEQIREIEKVKPAKTIVSQGATDSIAPLDEFHVKAILNYLNQRGYQMASFDRLRQKIDEKLTDQDFHNIIVRNPTVFRRAKVSNGKSGLAKVIP